VDDDVNENVKTVWAVSRVNGVYPKLDLSIDKTSNAN
jgi:hypothetical protein